MLNWFKKEKKNELIEKPNFNKIFTKFLLTKTESKALFARYCELASPNGKVEKRRLLLQPELLHCTLCKRILDLIPESYVDFESFLRIMVVMSPNFLRRNKIETLFNNASFTNHYDHNNSNIQNNNKNDYGSILYLASNGNLREFIRNHVAAGCDRIRGENFDNHRGNDQRFLESILYRYDIDKNINLNL